MERNQIDAVGAGIVEQADRVQAKRYADQRHPRRPDLKPYPIWGSSSGRYCCETCCGSKSSATCDLCGEGTASEFRVYGEGISNYFKFIKWAGWIFFFFSLISAPMMAVNTFGTGTTATGDLKLSRIAVTTVGNLGSAVNSTMVRIPDCDNHLFFRNDSESEAPMTSALSRAPCECHLQLVCLTPSLWRR